MDLYGPNHPRVAQRPIGHPDWSFELEWDGFRGLADTVHGRMLSKTEPHEAVRQLPRGAAGRLHLRWRDGGSDREGRIGGTADEVAATLQVEGTWDIPQD